MKAYNYDRVTKEYLGSETVFLDKVASMREGKHIYLMPAFSTDVEPPKDLDKYKVALWNGQKWEVKDDYRGEVLYNTNTRESMVCTEIGPMPKGYALELKPSLAELKGDYILTLKSNFNKYLRNTKITIPDLNLSFLYSSLENIKNEKELGLNISRDDNNVIYTDLTSEQYNDIIEYLLTFGQLVYLYKWEMEETIKKCKNIEILEGLKDKLNVKIDMSQLTNLMRMSEEKRRDYFTRIAKNIQ